MSGPWENPQTGAIEDAWWVNNPEPDPTLGDEWEEDEDDDYVPEEYK